MKKLILCMIALISLPTFSALAQDYDVKTDDSKIATVLSDKTSTPEVIAESIDWDSLDELVDADKDLNSDNKVSYHLQRDFGDPSMIEKALRHATYYKYLRENLYPLAFKD